MSLAKRAGIAFAVVFLVAVGSSAIVTGLARSSAARLSTVRTHELALDTSMWSLRSDFYNYDDQMNMYVAVLAGPRIKDQLAETTYQEAVKARRAMGADLRHAQTLTRDPGLLRHLRRLHSDYVAYNGFASQTRSAAKAGDVSKAVFISTRGNLKPSNDIMPTLDASSASVRHLVNAQMDGLERAQRTLQAVSVAAALLITLTIGALAWGTRAIVLRPLSRLKTAMVAIATGSADRTSRAPAKGGDEIAHVGQAFNTMLDALAAQDADLADAALQRESHLALNFEQQRAAEQQVRVRAQEVIDATAEGVAGELHGISSQVEIVRRAAATIDERVSATDSVTRSVVAQAQHAEQVVGELQASLREVGGMAALIAKVADQTKLLALNATIEASRAGEAGHGFSVVAAEVKDLAITTAQSTDKISVTIATLEGHSHAVAATIEEMSRGISAVDDATAVLREVAREQFSVVALLDDKVTQTVERVGSMNDLADRLERRRHQRVPVSGPIQVTIANDTHDGTLVDISEGGAHCSGPALRLLHAGHVGSVHFSLDGTPMSLTARIAETRGDAVTGDIGLEFVDATGASTNLIREYVAGHSGVAGNPGSPVPATSSA